jgi:hypothetical protein
MSRSGPQQELHALEKYVVELEKQFLAQYLNKRTLDAPTRKESLHAAAYVVLAHGALENFFEGLALWVQDKLVTNWTKRKRVTRSTASILLYHPAPKLDSANVTKTYEILRTELDAAKQIRSRAVYDNNGITLQHLHELFCPLGIDVPNDPVLIGSLDMVISMRHHWAHRYRFGATIIKSADNVKVAVNDCLTLAQRLANEVQSAQP